MHAQRYFMGLALGPAGQCSAVAVLGRRRLNGDEPPTERRPPCTLGHLRRFSPGTSYPEVFDAVRTLLRTPPLPGSCLLVECARVGRAVPKLLVDGLWGQVTCEYSLVAVTSGAEPAAEVKFQVPRLELASTLQVLLQTRRLLIPESLPDAAALVAEMQQFQLRVAAAGPESAEPWRDAARDDLVLAAGVAAWASERSLPRLYDPPPRHVRHYRV